MTGSFIAAAAAACWLGILTSISPCPLASNIAAVSYVGKKVTRTRLVILAGILYVAGRVIAYIAVASVLVAGILSVSRLSIALQENMNKLLGPILLAAGLFLLGFLQSKWTGLELGYKIQKKADTWGLWGALLLGFIFALSFCPVSAALFFGSLIPLSVSRQSNFILPAVYGIGTGLPVFIFAVLIAVSTRTVGVLFSRLASIELWFRRLTGIVFLLVGFYYTLSYLFEVDLQFI